MTQVTKRTTRTGAARYDVRWRLPVGSVRTRTLTRRKDADIFVTTLGADKLRGVVLDPAELMHRAGHISPAAALRYQHATEDRDRVLAAAMAALAPVADVVPIAARDGRATEAPDGPPDAGEPGP
ncbi:MAG TPA: hypothetical protein VKV36_05475 [Acidimicrobiales bacterium]|nr:hypothetical protein [Acidimicrobiales bacterium]